MKSISERHKLGRGYEILARWYFEGDLVVKSPAKAAYFATLALEKNQDTQLILDEAKSEMPESLIDEMERALAYYRKHDYPWIRTIPICNPSASWRDSQGKLHPPRPLTDEERKRLPPGCIQRD